MDTRSTDATEKIIMQWAEGRFDRHPEKFILRYYDWPGDSFAETRNYALQFCTEELILVIDGDETLEELIINEEGDFYWSVIDNFGRATLHCRLFKNKIGIQYKWRRHESIEDSIEALNLEPGKANIVIK